MGQNLGYNLQKLYIYNKTAGLGLGIDIGIKLYGS